MRTLSFIFLSIYFLFTSSCGCHEKGDCNWNYISTISLLDSTKIWLPYNDSNSISFKNQKNNTVIKFNNSSLIYDSSQMANSRINGFECHGDRTEACYDYYLLKSQNYIFSSQDVPFTITVQRTKNINPQIILSGTSPVPGDMLKVSFDNCPFHIKMNSDSLYFNDYNPNEEMNEFKDSVVLGNQIFKDVYCCYHSSQSLWAVYYTRNQGIVGFYQSDELWVLE